MHLRLRVDCPVFARENRFDLQRLLRLVASGRHSIIQPLQGQLEALLGAELWGQHREVLERAPKTAIDAKTFAAPWDCAACDTTRLVDFLELRTIVLIENPRSDGGFLSAVAGTLRPRLQRHLEEKTGAVDVRHGAGIPQIPAEIRRLAPAYTRLRVPGLPPRFVVIVDSDAPTPARPSLEAKRVQEAADDEGVLAHVLRKRSIENYIPDDALVAYVGTRRDRADAARSIISLSRVPRDHYPMKTGFDSLEVLSREEREIYPPDLPTGLKLGDFVGDLLETVRVALTVNGFRSRDPDDELEQLLDLLEENI